jgi:hypothetical protein
MRGVKGAATAAAATLLIWSVALWCGSLSLGWILFSKDRARSGYPAHSPA